MVQITLQLLWTPLFFRYRRLCLTAFVIVALIGASIATLVEFHKVDNLAGYILIPQILWTVFALYLNVHICAANF